MGCCCAFAEEEVGYAACVGVEVAYAACDGVEVAGTDGKKTWSREIQMKTTPRTFQ